ncbi:hypothetical protein [Gynurincola endophyticus]|uniref:hypothetical protein n=1 Tax=Gynurincola endophyticus TaxID=2479004 RepID=UPI000F8E4564|nr:hypothetical protein [Gynurincola endophyticus]
MKSISIILSTLFISLIGFGQQKADNTNRVQTLKIAYVTEKLNLTEAEAEKFWPIYKKYDNEFKNLRQANLKDRSDVVANEEKVVLLKKKYQGEFGKALSEEKIKLFFQAEKEFNEKVQTEFKRRIDNRADRPTPPQEQRLKNKVNN